MFISCNVYRDLAEPEEREVYQERSEIRDDPDQRDQWEREVLQVHKDSPDSQVVQETPVSRVTGNLLYIILSYSVHVGCISLLSYV